ncbi:unnamed protein product [Adineta steineri]|uniref:RanBP2-type domain-containing protein n=1 Tax=Adineta steineri TaxID=433720 RepID=A0A813Z479_9BILA|nr:unnamed protein product [Adineta steineri]CAF0892722.1 unnamed protein product [Adineta steineri]
MSTGVYHIRAGDWECGRCDHINFSSRANCQRCHTFKVLYGSARSVTVKYGDWLCGSCSKLNFATRQVCIKCGRLQYNYGTQVATS